MFNEVGVSRPRHDAARQVTGRARYGGDIHMDGMLFAAIKRSERAHAKIVRLDTAKAEALPGVRGVVTAKDTKANRTGFTHIDQPFLAEDRVRGYIDAMAAVAADTPEIARRAVELIEVEYEDLPGVFSPLDAMRPDAVLLHEGTGSNIASELTIFDGDVEEGFAQSDFVFEQDFSTSPVEQAHLEPHAAIAYEDDGGDLVVRASVQRAFTIAQDVAAVVQRPMSSVRVVASDLGGGFGGKNESTMEPIIALLCVKTKRPVKIEYTREDEFNCTTVRHPYLIHIKTGVKKSGKLHAREVRIISDCGPYVTWGASTLHKASIHACGPYDIPHKRVHGVLVYTNNCVGGAMRGFGVPQLGFAYELHMDYCARKLGIDPVAIRRMNFVSDGSKLATGMAMKVVTVNETMDAALRLAKERGDWE